MRSQAKSRSSELSRSVSISPRTRSIITRSRYVPTALARQARLSNAEIEDGNETADQGAGVYYLGRITKHDQPVTRAMPGRHRTVAHRPMLHRNKKVYFP